MKKRLAILTILFMLAAVMLAACADPKLTAIEILQQRYNDIATAKTIKQEITITQGNFTQYESTVTYTKTESGYNVTGSEKRLNDANAEQMYSVTQVNEQVSSASEAKPTIKLDESYFEEGYRLTETGLAATVKAEYVKEVFGTTDEDLKAPTNNLTVEMDVTDEHLATMRIGYVSDGSNVTIVLTMSY